MTHDPDILIAAGYHPTVYRKNDPATLCRAARELRICICRLKAFAMSSGGWQVWIKPTPKLHETKRP